MILYNQQYIKALAKSGTEYLAKQQKAAENKTEGEDVVQYKLKGVSAEGIEIYETSDEIKRLPYSQRKKRVFAYYDRKVQGKNCKV